jgi:hypothetical protein
MDTVDLRVPTKQIRDISTFNVSWLKPALVLQQGATRLKTFANLWTFSINTSIIPPLRIHFSLLNPTELHRYRVTCITLLSSIIVLWCSSSCSPSLAFVMYTFNARLLLASTLR